MLEISHELDLARWFIGEFEIAYASLCHSGILHIDVEDQVLIVAVREPSVRITIRLNFCSRPSRRNVVIRCINGELDWDLLQGQVKLTYSDQSTHCFRSSHSPDDRYLSQAQHFLSSIFHGSSPICSLNDGIQVLNLVNKAREMAKDKSVHSKTLP